MSIPSWVEKHSINCYYCGRLADERECYPNTEEYGGNDDGGSICPGCLRHVDKGGELRRI